VKARRVLFNLLGQLGDRSGWTAGIVHLPEMIYRHLSTKTNLALLSQLRKELSVPWSKAKEALVATGNDFDAAIEWLKRDAEASKQILADKLSSRVTKDGWIGLATMNGSGAMTRVNLNLSGLYA
jgi:elongation factor Ts